MQGVHTLRRHWIYRTRGEHANDYVIDAVVISN